MVGPMAVPPDNFMEINGHNVIKVRSIINGKTKEIKYKCRNCYEGVFNQGRPEVSRYVLGWFMNNPCPNEDGGRFNRDEPLLE